MWATPRTPVGPGFPDDGTPGTLGTRETDDDLHENRLLDRFVAPASVLKFEEGLSRNEADRLAKMQTGFVREVPFALPSCLSWTKYDSLLNAAIAWEADPAIRSKLERHKVHGDVVDIDGRKVYTMGRYR